MNKRLPASKVSR